MPFGASPAAGDAMLYALGGALKSQSWCWKVGVVATSLWRRLECDWAFLAFRRISSQSGYEA
jgi:hypothetical protein